MTTEATEAKPSDRMKTEDITGHEYHGWTVLRFSHYVRTQQVWICRCKCGHEKPVYRSNLIGNKSTRCWECMKGPRVPWRIGRNFDGLWSKIRNNSVWASMAEFHQDMAPATARFLVRHDRSQPHSKENSLWSDVDERRLETVDRVITYLVSQGESEDSAIERVTSFSKQRLYQFVNIVNGRCRCCGAPSEDRTVCVDCSKKTVQRRRKKRRAEDARRDADLSRGL